jgi:hypothetical protein
MGFFVGLMMWGFGFIWLCFALVAIYRSRPFPFNMGWWSFTFPLGVYAACTLQIGAELDSSFFNVLGTVSCSLGRRRVLFDDMLIWDACRCSLALFVCFGLLWRLER